MLICCTIQIYGQVSYVTTSDTIILTTERSISQEKIDNYRSQPAYNYDENPDYSESMLDRLWLRFKRWLQGVLGGDGYNILGNLIYYGLLLIALIAIIVLILRAQGHNPFARSERKSKTAIAVDLIDENSSVQSIDSLIAKAEIDRDYRLAIRLHYLKLLRLLDTAGTIQWRAGKTNHDYLLEIKNVNLKDKVDNLNYIYEYSWYGQFEIEDASQYQQLKDPFHHVYNEIRK